MPYGNAAPLTGGAGVLVFGHLFGLDDIIAGALAAVLFGIAIFRYGSRVGRARKMIFPLVGAAVVGVAFAAHLGGSLSWPLSTVAGLTAAVAALYLSSRIVPQERRVVA
jgi:hypothetical protein